MKLTNAERVLIEKMNLFKKDSIGIINALLHGIALASEISATDQPKLTNLTTIFSETLSIVSSLEIKTSSDDTEFISIYWCPNDCTDKAFSFSNSSDAAKPLTECTLMYSLMAFQAEVSNRLLMVENTSKKRSYLCRDLRNTLQSIIENYANK